MWLIDEYFKKPHKKKSGAVKSGERGDKAITPFRKIKCCNGKKRIYSQATCP